MVTRALELSGGSPAAHSNVGVVLMQLGRFDESVAHFHRAIAGEPDNNGFHGYLGYALLSAGRLAEAFDPVGPCDPGRPARHRTRHGRPAVDRRRHRRPRARLPGTGRRRRDHARVDVSRPRRPRARGDHRVRHPARPVVRAVVSRAPKSAPQTHDETRRETMHDFDRASPAGSLIRWLRPTARRVPRPTFVPRRRPRAGRGLAGPARRSRSGAVRRDQLAVEDPDRRTTARVHAPRRVGRHLRDARASPGSTCSTTTATASCATRRRASACASTAGTGSTS